MPMYNLIKYSDNYSKTSRSLHQFCSNEPNNPTTDSESFKFKSIFLNNTNNAGIMNAEMFVPLKYLSNFWTTPEIPGIKFEINFILTWIENYFIPEVKKLTTFTITDTNLYISVVTLSIQDNAKLLQQLKSAFKGTINWNKNQLKVTIERQKQYLDYLINPVFQDLNRVFVLLFGNTERTRRKDYFPPKVRLED